MAMIRKQSRRTDGETTKPPDAAQDATETGEATDDATAGDGDDAEAEQTDGETTKPPDAAQDATERPWRQSAEKQMLSAEARMSKGRTDQATE
jgi:hypothetical protein